MLVWYYKTTTTMTSPTPSDDRDEEVSTIQSLSLALNKTKNELIKWSLQTDHDGDTPIHLAIFQDNTQLSLYLCELLVSSGYDIDIKNKLMQTPFHLACITGKTELAESFMDLRAIRIDQLDRNGNTCLHLAVQHDLENCDTLRMLLRRIKTEAYRDVMVNLRNIHGYSALHVASKINKTEAIKLLVAHGAEINQPETKSGKSPLYLAVQERHAEAVRALLESGADTNCMTYFRDSPSQLASQDRRCMLRILSRYDNFSTTESVRSSKLPNSMVSQENETLATVQIQNQNRKATQSKDDTRSKVTMEGQNANLKSSPHGDGVEPSDVNGVIENKLIKEERYSPGPPRHQAYPSFTGQNGVPGPQIPTSEAHTSNTDQASIDLSNAREQLMRSVESLSRLRQGNMATLDGLGLSPASVSATISTKDVPKVTSDIYSNSGILLHKSGNDIPQFRGYHSNVDRGMMTSAIHSNDWFNRIQVKETRNVQLSESPQQCQDIEVTSVRGSETTRVSVNSAVKHPVSIKHQKREIASSEPLDLSQNRFQSALVPESSCRNESTLRTNNIANMLVDTEGKTHVENQIRFVKQTTTTEYVPTAVEKTKIKTEVIDNNEVESRHTGDIQELYPEKIQIKARPLLPVLPFPQSLEHQHLRKPFIPFGASWIDLQNAALSRQLLLPQAAFGYVPTTLDPIRNPLEALASLDPASIVQRNHAAGIAAGLSHWVNLSLDVARAVERLRQPAMSNQEERQSPRKRKYPAQTEDRSPSKEEQNSEVTVPKTFTSDSVKRIRLRESFSDGFQRSVSDDPGNSHNPEEHTIKKSLERRNSAPSSTVVNQMLRNEDNKKITPPVDLHSYTGCLPPHYLHLLQSSGNLPMTWREHALREVAEVYDTSRKQTTSKENSQFPQELNENVQDLVMKNRFPRINTLSNGRDTQADSTINRLYNRQYLVKSEQRQKEIWRPGMNQNGHKIPNGIDDNGRNRISGKDKPIASLKAHRDPAHSQNSFEQNHRKKLLAYYKRVGSFPTATPKFLPNENPRPFRERVRNSSETESDDEDYIQSLQISDASGDEEDEELSRYQGPKSTSNGRSTDSMQEGSLTGFGKGAWQSMDNGHLPAFGGAITTSTSSVYTNVTSTSSIFTPPTKIACSVREIVAQPLNGLTRVSCSSKVLNATSKPSERVNDMSEFLPHDVVDEPSKVAFRLMQKPSVGRNDNHRCSGCSRVTDKNRRRNQEDDTRKLLSKILRQSFGRNCQTSFLNTAPNSKPRLVFSSDVTTSKDIKNRIKESQLQSTTNQSKAILLPTTSSAAAQNTSTKAYTHKMFNASRIIKEHKLTSNAQKDFSTRIEKTNDANGRRAVKASNDRVSPFPSSGPLVGNNSTRPRRHSSSSSVPSRLNALDAKLEELHQKAMLATGTGDRTLNGTSVFENVDNKSGRYTSAISPFKKSDNIEEERENIPIHVKVEDETSFNSTSGRSPSRQVHPCSNSEPKQKTNTSSPFREGDSGRLATKRNVAVIKPNQSSAEIYKSHEKLPAYVCPPKKRHFKRYSPEIYASIRRNISPPDNREVRSASPVPRAPFVASSLVSTEEDIPRNVRWCSPERIPGLKKPHVLRPKALLSYHIPRSQLTSIRGSTNHTLMIENYRKFPRYVTSPRSNAVIVIGSRLPGRIIDNREDERLEIGDLEISDDEN